MKKRTSMSVRSAKAQQGQQICAPSLASEIQWRCSIASSGRPEQGGLDVFVKSLG